jgi:hypothetical protein
MDNKVMHGGDIEEIDEKIDALLITLRELNESRLRVIGEREGVVILPHDRAVSHAIICNGNKERGYDSSDVMPPDLAGGWGGNFFVFEPCDISYMHALYFKGQERMTIGWVFLPIWAFEYLFCFLWAMGECLAVKILVVPMWLASGGNTALVELWQRLLLPCWMLNPIDRAGHAELLQQATDYHSLRGCISHFVLVCLGGVWVFMFIGLWMIFWVLLSRIFMIIPMLHVFFFTGLNGPFMAYLCRLLYPPLIAPSHDMQAPQDLRGYFLC